ncbi:SxtJ family membrane protein [Glaciecola petra]|uniref:SxtJ family membrane protein n=1 Tax=Glaciecola petra TaxID=3075602 RepID=A0ABU2ZPX1_9ALTE|nr:SxtJ family membrane protein [Aestuariibacter sp. P117]MDT0594455.1 SxtJ family membrane protein [Aestuariibacter sp. P117]
MTKLQQWFKNEVLLPFAERQDVLALKSFALTMAVAFPAVFMLLLPWLFHGTLQGTVPLWPAMISFILMALYIFKPLFLYYPYVLWMIFASILGWFNTRIILALAYYFLIVPIGLFMQWRKGLQYKNKMPLESAWIPRKQKPNKHNLKEPF